MSSIESNPAEITLSLADVRALANAVLLKAGLSPAQAAPLARTIADAQRDECHSHGVYRLPGCVQTIGHPRFVRDAVPVLRDTSAAVTHVDAGYGFSLLAFETGLPMLVKKTRALGIGVLAINNCFHFSALWPEIEAITAQGLAALALTPSHSWVAPAGGKTGVLGTNPIAFGWPRGTEHPYVFDFATSAIARGDISLHQRAGKPLPEGWALDAAGQPTTDAGAALAGAMLTFGGHKGSALSTMVELLAGPLIGDMTSMDSMAFDNGHKAAPCHGEIIIAFDPKLLGGNDPEAQTARAEHLFAAITEQGARLPSQRRYAARARSLTHGVSIPANLYAELLQLVA